MNKDMQRRILFLGGKIKSGKDYTADILVNTMEWVKIPLAKPLKEIVAKKYNIPLGEFHTQSGKTMLHSDGRTYRQLLIDTASELKKNNENYFADILIENIRKEKYDRNIVVSDFRYPNEYERVSEVLGSEFLIETMKVVRNTYQLYDDPSETSLENFKFDRIHYNRHSSGSQHFNNSILLYGRTGIKKI